MSIGKSILASLRQQLNLTDYRKTHWEGGFDDYLDIVREHPEVTRNGLRLGLRQPGAGGRPTP